MTTPAPAPKPLPVIASKIPSTVELEPGTYWWCACGLSKTQPFCDKSHRAEKLFSPVKIELTAKKKMLLCNCKRTKTAPFCDNTHKTLP